MKTLRHLFTLLVFMLFLNIGSLSADTTETDNFNTDLEGWSGTGVSRANKSGSWKMRIERDRTASKTFNFGAAYANATVTLTFSLELDGGWENSGGSQDYFYVRVSGSPIETYSQTNGTYLKTVTTTTDGSGNLALSFYSDTTANDEYSYLDNIVVAVQSPAMGADLSLNEYLIPSPLYADVFEDVNISVRANNLGTLDANSTQILITYNQDVNITSASQNNGSDFNCTVSSGFLSAGTPITCTMTNALVSGASNKDFSFVVQATTLGVLIQTSVISSTTVDQNPSNNTLISTPVVIRTPGYCKKNSLSSGFHLIDPDGGSNKNSFEIFCYQDVTGEWLDLIALPIKNNSNNFLFNNNATSSNYYDTGLNPRAHFEAIAINANDITYSGTLNDGTPRPLIPVVISPNAEPYSITTAGNNYHVMGSSFSNINLTGTPFKIDWDNTGALGGCNENLLRKAFGQAVKYNTINTGTTNDGLSRCEISNMTLTLLDDYQFLTYGTDEVLQHSCKEMATYVPNNILNDADVAGHFNILTTEPAYVTGVPTTNGVRDNGQDIGATLRPLTVYCKYQTDLAYVWTFLTALDAKVTQYKTDLVTKQDTCSQLGLYFYVPNTKTTFNRVREYLKSKKTGVDGWENYTGTIEEKIKALYPGNVYYLSAFKDVLIWPYGPMGVYFPLNGNNQADGTYADWGDGANTPKEYMSGSPMHNITTIANYNDSMGKKGFVSILGSQDLNKTNEWWIADIGAGEEVGLSTPTYAPSGTHPIQSPGYIYYEPNGNYTANAWLNFLFDTEGWVYHNDDWNANYPYYDYMCMSETNYDTASRYSLIPGFFNVIERSKNIPPNFSNDDLSTQIVSDTLQLDIVLYKLDLVNLTVDKTQLNVDENKSVGVFLSTVEGENSPVPIKFLGEFEDFSGSNGRIEINDINITSAHKRMIAQFYYCDAADLNWTNCWNYNGNVDSPTVNALSGGSYSDSADDFAVRPKNFSLDVAGIDVVKAEQVTINYYAYDNDGQPTTGYNEPFINLEANTSISDITRIDFCPNKTLSIDFPADFVDGVGTGLTRLSNVGIFNIQLKEIAGQEFAVVDVDDTPDIDRYITPSDIDLTILPHHFSITPNPITNINHNSDGNFTYLSNNLDNMALKFDLNVTAKNDLNNVTPNYTSGCYSDITNIDLTYNSANIPIALTTLSYKELVSDVNGTVLATSNLVSNTLPANIFTALNSGTAEINLRVNFSRAVNNTINPFIVNFTDLNISDQNFAASGVVTGTDTSSGINVNGTMVYGRTHASRQRYEGPLGAANIYYEVFCSPSIGTACTKTLINGFTSTNTDDIRWFINTAHVNSDGNPGVVDEKNSLVNVTAGAVNTAPNPNTVNLTYNEGKGYPYKTTMENNASLWLIYNESDPFATRNEFQVEFDNIGAWTGENETDTTTTTPAGATTNRRIMW